MSDVIDIMWCSSCNEAGRREVECCDAKKEVIGWMEVIETHVPESEEL